MADVRLDEARKLLEQAASASDSWDFARQGQLASAVLELLGNDPAGIEVRAKAHLMAAQSFTVTGQPIKAQTHYEHALADFERCEGHARELAQVELGLAQCAFLRGETNAARQIWDRLLMQVRQAGWRDLEAYILHQQGQSLVEEGETGAALAMLSAARKVHQDLNDLRRQHHIQLILCNALIQAGRMEEAKELLAESLAYYNQHGPAVTLASCLTNLGGIAIMEGDMETARQLFTKSRDLPGAAPHNLAYSNLHLGVLEMLNDEWPAAQKYLVRARQVFEQMGYRNMLMLNHGLLAAWRMFQGDTAAAEDELRCASRLAETLGGTPEDLSAGIWAVWLLAHDAIERAQGMWEVHQLSEPELRRVLDRVLAHLLTKLIDGIPGLELSVAALAQARLWLVSVLAPASPSGL